MIVAYFADLCDLKPRTWKNTTKTFWLEQFNAIDGKKRKCWYLYVSEGTSNVSLF